MSKSDALENHVLLECTGQATTLITTTPLAGVWLALYTAAPSDTGGGTEATGGGYARVDTKGSWGAPSGGSVSNNAEVAFAQFTGAVSTGAAFTHFGLLTASTAGSLLRWGALTDQTKTGGANDTIRFPAGSLVLTED